MSASSYMYNVYRPTRLSYCFLLDSSTKSQDQATHGTSVCDGGACNHSACVVRQPTDDVASESEKSSESVEIANFCVVFEETGTRCEYTRNFMH